MLTIEEVEKEKEFLRDAFQYYVSKEAWSPDFQRQYDALKKQKVFDYEEFMDVCRMNKKILDIIYFAGIIEYSSKLTFPQFIYFCFYQKPQNRIRMYRTRIARALDNVKFRQQIKFKNKNHLKKELSPLEKRNKDWREFKKINKDRYKNGNNRYKSYIRSKKYRYKAGELE